MKKTVRCFTDKRGFEKLVELDTKSPDNSGQALEIIFAYQNMDILNKYQMTITIEKEDLPFWYKLKRKAQRIWQIIKE